MQSSTVPDRQRRNWQRFGPICSSIRPLPATTRRKSAFRGGVPRCSYRGSLRRLRETSSTFPSVTCQIGALQRSITGKSFRRCSTNNSGGRRMGERRAVYDARQRRHREVATVGCTIAPVKPTTARGSDK